MSLRIWSVRRTACRAEALEGKETMVNEESESGRERAIEVVRQSIENYIDRFCK